MVGSEDEAQAVAQARRGDTEAFRILVERHSRDVFRLAFRMTGNEHDAEDVVQETFWKAYRKLAAFEERSQFGSWVHRIAANCAYDLLRARVRQDERVERAEGPDGVRTLTVAAGDPSPERLVAGGEVRGRVRAAMARLSALERSAFTLRHVEGMTIAEISHALDLDASAAKQSVFRAVRKLRQALGDHRPWGTTS
ncbi:MAG TPA: RNA polymerase sigma factor [Vicinamibacteria bacterium]|nr:RNA polymerase sigma factor [Vicinamibacteria bacterium]